MKKLLRILLFILTIYFLYAFAFSVIIYAFKSPSLGAKEAKRQSASCDQQAPHKRASHRVQLIPSPQDALASRIKLIFF